MNDQAASALGNISVWAWIWYGAAGALITALLFWSLVAIVFWWRDVAVIAWQLARSYLRRRKLIGAIVIPGAQRPTRPMRIGDLVISAEGERLLQARAAALTSDAATEVIDPDPALGCPCCPGARFNDCTCAIPCGDPSCQAIGECEWCDLPALLAPAPCACPGNCGAPWCASEVRHGR